MNARRVGRERLHELDARLPAQIGIRVTPATGLRKPLRMHHGRLVGGRCESVHRPVASETIRALHTGRGARRIQPRVDALRERRLDVAADGLGVLTFDLPGEKAQKGPRRGLVFPRYQQLDADRRRVWDPELGDHGRCQWQSLDR